MFCMQIITITVISLPTRNECLSSRESSSRSILLTLLS